MVNPFLKNNNVSKTNIALLAPGEEHVNPFLSTNTPTQTTNKPIEQKRTNPFLNTTTSGNTSTAIPNDTSGLDVAKAQMSAKKAVSKWERLTGNVTEDRAMLEQKGYIPEITGLTLKQKAMAQTAWPLQRLLQTVQTAARTPAAIQQEVQRKAMENPDYKPISEFDQSTYNPGKQAVKNLNPMNAIRQLAGIGKEGWKEVGKATFEPIINQKSEYTNYGFNEPNRELLKGTAVDTSALDLMKPTLDRYKNGNALQRAYYNFATSTMPDEKGNWWQRLTSGFAGTPLNVISLAEDIIFDFSTYIGGGALKGSVSKGVALSDDVIKNGMKVMPKGAEVVFTKAGDKAFISYLAAKYNDELFDIGAGIRKASNGATDEIARATMRNEVMNRAVNSFIQDVPDVVNFNKYVDPAGMNIFGGTIPGLSGAKIARAGEKFAGTKFGKVIQEATNVNAGLPKTLKPVKQWLESANDAETGNAIKTYAKIIENTGEESLDKIRNFSWVSSDIERVQGKIEGLQTKYATAIDPIKAEVDRVQKLINDPNNVIPFAKDSNVDIAKAYLQSPQLYANDIPIKFGGKAVKGTSPFSDQTWASAVLDINNDVSKGLVGGAELDSSLFKKILKGQVEGLPDKPYAYINKLIAKVKSIENKFFKSAGRAEETVAKYADLIKGFKLNTKDINTADRLAEFWQDMAKRYTAATGVPIETYQRYTPGALVRDIVDNSIAKKQTLLGTVDPSFLKSKRLTFAQAQKLKADAIASGASKSAIKAVTMEDPVTAAIRRIQSQGQNVYRTRVLEEVKQFGEIKNPLTKTVPKGMVEVKNIPELKGFYLPEELHNVFTKSYKTFFGDKTTEKILSYYDKGLTVWKRSVLATPGYHFRNFFTDNVSGLMEWGTDFYSPKYWDMRTKIMKNGGKNHELITINGKSMYTDDLYKELIENGTLVTQSAQEGAVRTIAGIKAKDKFNKGVAKVSPFEISLQLGAKRENVARVVGYLIERDKGLSGIMAASKVKDVFFDYAHSLSKFEQNVGKRIVPFLTWMKNNARRQVELVLTRTGRYAAIPKAMNFVRNIAEVPEGYDEFKQPYLKGLGAFPTFLRNPGRMDWWSKLTDQEKTTQAGNLIQISPNFGFQDWSRLNWKDFMSAFAPFIKIPIELAMNKSLFYGYPIYSDSATNTIVKDVEANKLMQKILAKAPSSALDVLGMQRRDSDGKITIRPLAAYLWSQIPQFALSQRAFSGQDNALGQTVSTLFGIKGVEYDSDKAKESYYKRKRSEFSLASSEAEQRK